MVALDDPLSYADVHRAALDARRAALAPEAEIALGERVLLRVVRDAAALVERELVRRVRFVADRERARLGAPAAGDAGVLADEARAGARLDLERVDGTDVQAFRGGALEARLLMERAAIRVGRLD